MTTLNRILNDLKEEFENEVGIKIDFRTHVFLDNNYGAYPVFDYNLAEEIVPFVYKYLTEYLDENQEDYPEFGGWEYNTNMSIEQLRTTPLKAFIENKIGDMLAYKI